MHKIWPEEEHTTGEIYMKTSIIQVWMECHLLPFARVGQH